MSRRGRARTEENGWMRGGRSPLLRHWWERRARTLVRGGQQQHSLSPLQLACLQKPHHSGRQAGCQAGWLGCPSLSSSISQLWRSPPVPETFPQLSGSVTHIHSKSITPTLRPTLPNRRRIHTSIQFVLSPCKQPKYPTEPTKSNHPSTLCWPREQSSQQSRPRPFSSPLVSSGTLSGLRKAKLPALHYTTTATTSLYVLQTNAPR